jgi:FMN phosphatase YigB (HAD superfamily)
MIRSIIFDFGGVIYDIDHNLSKLAFQKLGVDNFDQLYGHHVQTHIFEQFETGKIDAEAFLAYLAKFLPAKTSKEDIIDAWCALLIGIDERKTNLLLELKKDYRLFLLSNSNILHYQRFIEEVNGIADLRSVFDDVWFSHEKGKRKPDLSFFNELVEANQLNVKETLFIDDLLTNIKAAEKVRLKTWHIQEESIVQLFSNKNWVQKYLF